MFFCEFYEIFKNTFFTEHLWETSSEYTVKLQSWSNPLHKKMRLSITHFFSKCNQIRSFTAHKMKFSIKDFFSKRDQIRSFLRIWLHLLNKSLIKNVIFCAVFPADLVTFTEEIPNGKLHFLCSDPAEQNH